MAADRESDRRRDDLSRDGLRKRESLGQGARAGAYWEIIADNLSKAGWSWGWVSALDREGRTIFVADAHRGDGQRFVVYADEKLTAFLELERVTGFALEGAE